MIKNPIVITRDYLMFRNPYYVKSLITGFLVCSKNEDGEEVVHSDLLYFREEANNFAIELYYNYCQNQRTP